MFPLDIQYRLKHPYACDSPQHAIVVGVIENKLKKLKVDRFVKDLGRTRFRNRLFADRSSGHIFAIVDGGYIEYQDCCVRISFSTKRSALLILVPAFFLILLSGWPPLGILCFTWLYGMNVIILFIRGKLFIKKLRKEIQNCQYECRTTD